MFAGSSPISILDQDGNEKIVISGVEEPKGRYRLTFILTAMKFIKGTANNSESTKWIIFTKGYSPKQIAKINDWASKQTKVTVLWVNSSQDVVKYLNSKGNCKQLTPERIKDPVTNVTIFSHGKPNEIRFGYLNPDVDKNYTFGKEEANQLEKGAFQQGKDGSKWTIYACRIGASKDVEKDWNGFNNYDTDPENSLAQEIADNTGSTVEAYQNRTDYNGILGNKIILKSKDIFGISTNREESGDSWDKNIDEINLPKVGDTPLFSPGKTEFKPNVTPQTIDY